MIILSFPFVNIWLIFAITRFNWVYNPINQLFLLPNPLIFQYYVFFQCQHLNTPFVPHRGRHVAFWANDTPFNEKRFKFCAHYFSFKFGDYVACVRLWGFCQFANFATCEGFYINQGSVLVWARGGQMLAWKRLKY